MAKTAPKLAIITRTKDRPSLLLRMLKSLDSQTSKEFKHIIINDGGDKEELEAVLREVPHANRTVVHNKTSNGLVATLNQGVRTAEAEYISILDDDDTWHPARVETTVGYMDSHHEVAAAVVKMDIVEEELSSAGRLTEIKRYLHPESGDGEIGLYKQCIRNYISNGIVIYRKSAYEEVGGYDESLATAEDWDFGIRLMLKYDVDLIKTDESLFYYHQRPKATGVVGNSVHAGVQTQEETVNRIRNKYLRSDLQNGKLGVGVIMNQAVFDTANIVRLEGHMNHVGEDIMNTVRQHGLAAKIVNRIKR